MSNGEYFWYFVGLAISSPTNLLGLFLLLFVTGTLLYAQFGKSKVDLTYLLVDQSIGNVTLAKFAGFVALVTTTWIIVRMAATDKFDAGWGTTYLLTWAGVKVASDFAQTREAKKKEPPAPGTIETTTLRKELQVQPAAAEAATDVEAPPKPKPNKPRKRS